MWFLYFRPHFLKANTTANVEPLVHPKGIKKCRFRLYLPESKDFHKE